MSYSENQSRAAAIVATTASLLTLLPAGIIAAQSLSAKAIVFLIGVVGYYAIFQACLLLGGLWRYRSVLGSWVYVSWQWARPEAHSFAMMKFKMVDGGQLKYEVSSYRSVEDVQRAVAKTPTVATGEATSITCRYDDEHDKVDLIYEFRLHANDPNLVARRGMIQIKRQPGDVLEGQWVSAVGDQINLGMWVAVRPPKIKELLAHLSEYQTDIAGRLGAHTPTPKGPTPPPEEPPQQV